MKTIHKITIGLLFMLCVGTTYAQNNGDGLKAKNGNIVAEKSIKPLRVGIKDGIPNIISINVEYVTELLGGRVAPTIDYNPFKFNLSDLEIKFSNIEFGANVYANDTGKGFYGGLSYASFNADVYNPEAEFDDGSFGPGNAKVEFNSINAKIGVKLGRTFYFRLELGYGFGSLPNEFITISQDGNSKQIEAIEDIRFLGSSGLPLFNFGIGFGFL